jgi:hypothetical protein
MRGRPEPEQADALWKRIEWAWIIAGRLGSGVDPLRLASESYGPALAERTRQGRILLMNGHGGNEPVRGRIFEVASELPDLRLAWYNWWQSHSFEMVVQEYALKPGHANWMEAFPFTRVSDLPEAEKLPPHVPGMLGAIEARQVYGDGSFGGAYQVETGIMDQSSGRVRDVPNCCLRVIST